MGFLSLTGPQISKVAAKDPGVILFFQGLIRIVRNLAQAGEGVVVRTSPFLPSMTVAEADALVVLARESMGVEPIGLRVTISDSSVAPAPATFWGIITGGGADVAPAFWDGSVWRLA